MNRASYRAHLMLVNNVGLLLSVAFFVSGLMLVNFDTKQSCKFVHFTVCAHANKIPFSFHSVDWMDLLGLFALYYLFSVCVVFRSIVTLSSITEAKPNSVELTVEGTCKSFVISVILVLSKLPMEFRHSSIFFITFLLARTCMHTVCMRMWPKYTEIEMTVIRWRVFY